jgi:hypothetical protein
MTAAVDALHQMRAFLGMVETPLGSNRCPVTAEYGLIGPWCNMGTSLALTHAGLNHRFAYVPAEVDAAKNGKDGFRWIIGWANAQPGDLIVFDYQGGSATAGADHIGMVETNNTDGTKTTIECNVSDACKRLVRRNDGTVMGFVRPPYVEPAPTPPTPGNPYLGRRETVDVIQHPSTSRVDVVTIGTNKMVFHSFANTAKALLTADFENLGGEAKSVSASWSGEEFIIAAQGADDGLWFKRWDGKKWLDWVRHPGAALFPI